MFQVGTRERRIPVADTIDELHVRICVKASEAQTIGCRSTAELSIMGVITKALRRFEI